MPSLVGEADPQTFPQTLSENSGYFRPKGKQVPERQSSHREHAATSHPML